MNAQLLVILSTKSLIFDSAPHPLSLMAEEMPFIR